jgi:thiamine pyrophosphate-dependent acetolactate synthase large subunit-like protein
MSWKTDFYQIISNLPEVSAVVGSRIDWPQIEIGTVLPAIAYKCIDNDAKHTTTGTTHEYRDIEVQIHGDNGDVLDALAETLRDEKDGIEGKAYGGIKNIWLMDDFDDKGTETKSARVVQIYRVEYKRVN